MLYQSPYAKMGGNVSDYEREPIFTRFLAGIPTFWTDTRVLDGRIADYIVMLRQGSDGAWWVGAMTDWTPRELTLPLGFLPQGSFIAEVWQDGPNAARYASDWRRDERTVTRADTLPIRMRPAGAGWRDWNARRERWGPQVLAQRPSPPNTFIRDRATGPAGPISVMQRARRRELGLNIAEVRQQGSEFADVLGQRALLALHLRDQHFELEDFEGEGPGQVVLLAHCPRLGWLDRAGGHGSRQRRLCMTLATSHHARVARSMTIMWRTAPHARNFSCRVSTEAVVEFGAAAPDWQRRTREHTGRPLGTYGAKR